MLNPARMCLPGGVHMVGMLIGTDHPSFSHTANTSCSIRASFFQIPIFNLPYQNVIIIRGNFIYCHTFLDTCFVLCQRLLLLSVCCVLLARCWSLHWRLFLPVACAWLGGPGEQSGHLCRWDHTESHRPDPGLAGHQEMRQAVGDTLSTGVVPEEERLRIRV